MTSYHCSHHQQTQMQVTVGVFPQLYQLQLSKYICTSREAPEYSLQQWTILSIRLGNHLPPVSMTHFVPGLKCDMTLNIFGTFA
jgi:hypothetical protein